MGDEKGADSWSDSPARGQHSRGTLEVWEKVCKTLIHICCLLCWNTRIQKQLINNFRLAPSGICHSIKLSFKKTKLAAWTPAADTPTPHPCFLALYYLSWSRPTSAITRVLQAALGPLKLTLWNISGEMLQVQRAGRHPEASSHQSGILKSFVHHPSGY